MNAPAALDSALASGTATRAIRSAALSLAGFGGCVLMFIPPFSDATDDSVALAVVLGVAMAVCAILHLVFVGIAAKRLGRSVAGWVAAAVLLFPVGSIVALVLFEWFGEERQTRQLS
jgi:drug/metabolite transporter (DMT)-like permease